MARIKLTIEYDGTDYVGWQVQPNGVSVQQRVELALEQLLEEATRDDDENVPRRIHGLFVRQR